MERALTHSFATALICVGLCALAGCPSPDPVGPSPSAVPEPTTLDQQLAIGDEIFGAICSHCHGPAGEGSDEGPALIAPDALESFETAKEVYDYAKENMPPGNPGALEDRKYWAAVAWVLRRNRVDLGTAVLGPANAAQVKLKTSSPPE